MDISCVLLTWNSERYLEKCLESLVTALNESRLTYEIFIVDNGSCDQTVELLQHAQAQEPEHIFPLYLEKNTGTTYSRNLALKRATGSYLCIMDSDVEITPAIIPRLLKTLEQHPRAGLVAPELRYPTGTLQKSTDEFPTVTRKALRYFFLKAMEKREHEQALKTGRSESGVRDVDYAISAMWLLKREVLDAVGLLDEKIFYAPEDADYCLRLWKSGFSVLYDPAVSCVHHTQEISRGFRLSRAMITHVQGLWYYFRKHRYFFRKPKI